MGYRHVNMLEGKSVRLVCKGWDAFRKSSTANITLEYAPNIKKRRPAGAFVVSFEL